MPTVFWWDNFDQNVDIEAGGGSIHNTPGVAFQEKTEPTKLCQLEQEMAKTNRRSLIVEEDEPFLFSKINPKCNPGIMLGPKAVRNANVFNIIDELLALWKAFRYAGIEKKNPSLCRFS